MAIHPVMNRFRTYAALALTALCGTAVSAGAQSVDAASMAEPARSRGAMRYITPLLSAGWGQVLKAPKGWPRTIGGYASRAGDQYGYLIAKEGVEHIVDRAVPWVEDHSSCMKQPAAFARELVTRFGCAVARTSTMRTNDDELRPNLPFIAGTVIGSGVSLTWRPERHSAVSSRAFVLQRIGITYGATALVRMITDWRADAKAAR